MKSLEQIVSAWPLKHHAYGISHENVSLEYVKGIFKEQEVSYLYAKRIYHLGIDDVRAIQQLQQERSHHAKVFIIQFTAIYHEAQNAFLKILEEPKENSIIIIICPSIRALLPTIQSRIEEIILEKASKELGGLVPNSLDAERFLDIGLPERYEMIKKFTDRNKDNLADGALHQEAKDFLNVLERNIRARSTTPTPENYELLKLIFKSKNHLTKQGSSIKMILDLLATATVVYQKNKLAPIQQ